MSLVVRTGRIAKVVNILKKCVFRCGDGGPATQARLAFPKGLAVSVDRSVYISDGKSVRIVHQNGRIDTLIGAHLPNKHLIPIGCDTFYLVSQQ